MLTHYPQKFGSFLGQKQTVLLNELAVGPVHIPRRDLISWKLFAAAENGRLGVFLSAEFSAVKQVAAVREPTSVFDRLPSWTLLC